ncbi:MAG TPA: NmrA family NAD(P)-binding protein [Nitrospirota bacterium]|nr:NmrA family NAD(P)-binding protein [Nitrospirota bacterium]
MITILGASGHIGGKIADILIKKDIAVRLVARHVDALKPRVKKHVEVMAGDINDTEFLAKALKGSDAVYTLIPPDLTTKNFLSYADGVGASIGKAIELAKVPFVVNLSSIGAELSEGTGPIVGLHRQEERLNRIKDTHILHVRAAYFMENLLGNVDLIKSKGIAGTAIRGDIKFPMIASRDIATYIAERLMKKDFKGHTVHYLAGERDLSLIEATEIIGRKIGKPGLPYLMFPYDEAEKGLTSMGLSPDMSKRYVEMSRAFNEGRVKPEARSRDNTTPTSIESFCDDVFVPLFMQKKVA